uniref:Uncharacterized protein n=1 Tax=Cucumis sativus TaxID=3659 RepID=A0A0A0LD36_CUCSA
MCFSMIHLLFIIYFIFKVKDVSPARSFGNQGKNGGVFPRHDAMPKVDALTEKPLKFYHADDVKKPLVDKRKSKPTTLIFLIYLSFGKIILIQTSK